MRGRVQAAVVAIAGSWFPLVSPATVALVALRRGPVDGALILLWALLPVMLAFFVSDMGPFMPAITLAGMLVCYGGALLLRAFGSWQQTLLGLVALSTLAALAIGYFVADPVADVTREMGELFGEMQKASTPDVAFTAPTSVFVLGLAAYVLVISSLLSLVLGRWWQALLYNPGGFQGEFHALRLAPMAAVVCVGAMVYCLVKGLDYTVWSSVFGMPLLVAAVALVHHLVTLKNKSMHWLVVFYLALLLIRPLSMLLAIVGLLDAWLNLRRRVASGRSQD